MSASAPPLKGSGPTAWRMTKRWRIGGAASWAGSTSTADAGGTSGIGALNRAPSAAGKAPANAPTAMTQRRSSWVRRADSVESVRPVRSTTTSMPQRPGRGGRR